MRIYIWFVTPKPFSEELLVNLLIIPTQME